MGMIDDIKAGAKGNKGIEAMMIEQKLNQLFYVKPNWELEREMLDFQKNQIQQTGDRYGLHLSSIIAGEADFCYREQLLSLFYKMNQGSDVPIGLKRIFQEGNYIGEKWQRMMISGGYGVKENMDVSHFLPEYDLSYTPDIECDILGKHYVTETKSQNTYTFNKTTTHPSGTKQLRMYMFFRKKRHGFVLVEDKNDQKIRILPEEWKITFTKDDIAPYIERLETIQEMKYEFLKDKKVPKRKCANCDTKRALGCNMREACFNIGEGRQKLPKDLRAKVMEASK